MESIRFDTSNQDLFSYGTKVGYRDLDMNNYTVKNLREPAQGQEAATKTYVDNSTAGSISSGDDLAFKSLNLNGATLGNNTLAISGPFRFQSGGDIIAGDFNIGTGGNRWRILGNLGYIQRDNTMRFGRIGQGTTALFYNPVSARLTIQKDIGGGDFGNGTIRAEGGISAGKTTDPVTELDVEGDCDITGHLTAGSKAFKIPHPNPQYTNTHHLNHSCIESNTAGDCYYSYKVYVEDEYILQLPPYFKYLIDNATVKAHITPIDNLIMVCYSVIDEDHIKIKTSAPSNVSVLVSGTRKDADAVKFWKGESTVKPPPPPPSDDDVVDGEN